jgi:hypothetical protein
MSPNDRARPARRARLPTHRRGLHDDRARSTHDLRGTMTNTSPPIAEPSPAPTVHASEDDLEALLAGETVELPYPGERESAPDTVVWEPDPSHPLDPAAVLALRGDGLHHRVRDPYGDEPFIPLMRIGADRALRNPDRPGEVQVTLTEEGYRMLCGIVQGDRRVDRDEITGTAWPELRRAFPAAEYVRQPSGRIEVGGIASQNPEEAGSIARQMIVETLPPGGDWDVVVLAAVRESDGRYSVTVVYHHPELSEHGTRRLTPSSAGCACRNASGFAKSKGGH